MQVNPLGTSLEVLLILTFSVLFLRFTTTGSTAHFQFPDLRVDLNPLKKKFTRSYVRNVRIDFPTLLLKWYKKPVKFVFRTCFDTIIHVRALGHCKRSRRSARKWLGIEGAPFMYATSDHLETWRIPSGTIRSRQYHESTVITTCPFYTASSTLSCFFQQKERDKAEVSTSRGGTGARCVRLWLTRDIV